MRILFLLSNALLFLSASFSTTSITLRGRVLLQDLGPAVGASINIKGTTLGTVTDNKGNFSINVEKLPITIVCTAIGYGAKEYKVTEKNVTQAIVIKLVPVKSDLEEVVVVGYASEGFVGTKSEAMISAPAAGVIRIRGARTAAATELVKKVPGVSVDKKVIAEDKTTMASLKDSIKKRPGILTAGELSDFKKWKLWGDYSQSEFKRWSEQWELLFKDRYCVLVQNQDRAGLVGKQVHLVNISTKDTVWSAVTDNTGKAELWSNLKAEDQQSIYKIVCENEEVKFPLLFQNGINRIGLKGSCAVSNEVDIAFVVDATGSMGDEIQYLKEELNDIITKTTEKYKEVNLHLASVFYRDHGDEYLVRQTDFDKDVARLVGFIQNQSAGGGGDTPEAVDEALTVALENLHWTEGSRARILFLVLDAPPHDAAKGKMHVLIKRAAEKGIRIVPVVCSGIDKSAEYLMRCIALATNGSYVFLTDDSGIGNPHIKPTTDEFKVELLNNLLQRLIGEMIYVQSCNPKQNEVDPADIVVKNNMKLSVYPNPTAGKINIAASEKIEELYITDFAGKILMKANVSNKSGKCEVDLINYPSGTYLVKYFIKDKGWGAEKVILLH